MPQATFSSPLCEVMRTWRGLSPWQGIKGQHRNSETHDVPARVWGQQAAYQRQEAQMASWESDQLVVVMKQGNACGAKGLAGERGAGTLPPDSEPG